MRAYGFTLIELLIFVAVIAVIAAIAVPSIRRSALSAHETAAGANCKAYVGAQQIYVRQDWDNDGIREYASDYRRLHTAGTGEAIELIGRDFAAASQKNTAPVHKAGYLFDDLTGMYDRALGAVVTFTASTTGDADYTDGFGMVGEPKTYNRTGRKVFVVALDVPVYMTENIAGVVNQGKLVGRIYPDVAAGGWMVFE